MSAVRAESQQEGPAEEVGRPRPPRRGYLVPGVIALVVIAGLAAAFDAFVLQVHTPKHLAGSEVESFLAQAVQAQDGLSSPPAVHCPANEPVRVGIVFDCTLLRAGRATQTLRVTETSTAGTFSYRPIPSG